MVTKSKAAVLGIGLLLIAAVIIYKFYFYEYIEWFPKCPFRKLTGYQCPGCGSQRALSHLLNLNISGAFTQNGLLVLSLPYLLLYYILEISKPEKPYWIRFKKMLFGAGAIKIVLAIIILFWILRNI